MRVEGSGFRGQGSGHLAPRALNDLVGSVAQLDGERGDSGHGGKIGPMHFDLGSACEQVLHHETGDEGEGRGARRMRREEKEEGEERREARGMMVSRTSMSKRVRERNAGRRDANDDGDGDEGKRMRRRQYKFQRALPPQGCSGGARLPSP